MESVTAVADRETMRSQRSLVPYARENRKAMNHAETRLWWELRRDRFGVRFRRQHPFKGYILDFACLPIRLAVEVDGSQHADSARDRRRDAVLQSDGWTMVRVWSWDVFRNTQGVLDAIGAAIEEASLRSTE